jgi:hypothetical protein
MSTTDPDARDRRVALLLRPFALIAAGAVQFLAPALALISLLGIASLDPGFIMLYVIAWVVVGLAALVVPSGRSPYLIAAFILAYIGGLFVVIAVTTPGAAGVDVLNTVVIAGTYGIAVALVALFLVSEAALRRTRETGVDATATVMSAPMSGRVNEVARQRLTLRFTDQQGVERFLRVGRTGGGWSVGDTVPIRYDPTRPGYRRGILVDGSGPTLFS